MDDVPAVKIEPECPIKEEDMIPMEPECVLDQECDAVTQVWVKSELESGYANSVDGSNKEVMLEEADGTSDVEEEETDLKEEEDVEEDSISQAPLVCEKVE
ncbi:uncharacterized protein [Anabrus simplex]|uniref:uncharacterized protein isoform X2 n=1 Tax=Anabrus simplex TaxID=316456 RepID=UPI0034DD22C6